MKASFSQSEEVFYSSHLKMHYDTNITPMFPYTFHGCLTMHADIKENTLSDLSLYLVLDG